MADVMLSAIENGITVEAFLKTLTKELIADKENGLVHPKLNLVTCEKTQKGFNSFVKKGDLMLDLSQGSGKTIKNNLSRWAMLVESGISRNENEGFREWADRADNLWAAYKAAYHAAKECGFEGPIGPYNDKQMDNWLSLARLTQADVDREKAKAEAEAKLKAEAEAKAKAEAEAEAAKAKKAAEAKAKAEAEAAKKAAEAEAAKKAAEADKNKKAEAAKKAAEAEAAKKAAEAAKNAEAEAAKKAAEAEAAKKAAEAEAKQQSAEVLTLKEKKASLQERLPVPAPKQASKECKQKVFEVMTELEKELNLFELGVLADLINQKIAAHNAAIKTQSKRA